MIDTLCKNCGHPIIEYEGEYFHARPSWRVNYFYVSKNCDYGAISFNYCSCDKPEPEGDDENAIQDTGDKR